jgi:hypothetical protein
MNDDGTASFTSNIESSRCTIEVEALDAFQYWRMLLRVRSGAGTNGTGVEVNRAARKTLFGLHCAEGHAPSPES